MLNCYPSWNYHFAPGKKWGWKTQFILGSSYFQGRDVSLRRKCNLLLILEKLLTDRLTEGVITSTSLPGPQQCTSTGTLSWLPPDPKRSRKRGWGWCWQVPIKKELLHFILKSLKRHLLLHERKLAKKNVGLIPMIRQSALMPQWLIWDDAWLMNFHMSKPGFSDSNLTVIPNQVWIVW